jgi:hypothetical protein
VYPASSARRSSRLRPDRRTRARGARTSRARRRCAPPWCRAETTQARARGRLRGGRGHRGPPSRKDSPRAARARGSRGSRRCRAPGRRPGPVRSRARGDDRRRLPRVEAMARAIRLGPSFLVEVGRPHHPLLKVRPKLGGRELLVHDSPATEHEHVSIHWTNRLSNPGTRDPARAGHRTARFREATHSRRGARLRASRRIAMWVSCAAASTTSCRKLPIGNA